MCVWDYKHRLASLKHVTWNGENETRQPVSKSHIKLQYSFCLFWQKKLEELFDQLFNDLLKNQELNGIIIYFQELSNSYSLYFTLKI